MHDTAPPAPEVEPATDPQPLRPKAVLFSALAVVWFFPSLFAVSLLKPVPKSGAGYFRNVYRTVLTMDWFSWLLLAPAFVFAGLALYYYGTERSRSRGNRPPDRLGGP
jgi:hypothetical protein